MTLKFFALLLFSLTCLSAARAQRPPAGINFYDGTVASAVAEAKKEKKLVFFDAYASWCGPCRYMDSVIYSDREVGKFFNQHFISIRVNMEKGEGPLLAKKYGSINGYPSLLFLDGDGMAIKTLLGSRSKSALLGEARLSLVN
jgi:thioredoxin 1